MKWKQFSYLESIIFTNSDVEISSEVDMTGERHFFLK
jgi:hypothetical protein